MSVHVPLKLLFAVSASRGGLHFRRTPPARLVRECEANFHGQVS
ncbi:hypothetical protein RHECNPAF_4460017 [Rhizobium etli CNPAF512]|nr:hypothetical protein RHECNPAF_4460017 [Rhizobium etli CNPAF512]